MGSAGGEASGCPIFISYRRVDRAAFADPFFERLTDWFGPDAVFLDRKDIELGARFPDELDRAVRAAKVVLVLITPQWLPELNRRLKVSPLERDYVRMEVALALSLPGCVVIPVYWCCQPGEKADLPEDVQGLLDRNSTVDGPLMLADDAKSWGVPYLKLRDRIEAVTGLMPVPSQADQDFWNTTQQRISGLLQKEAMKAVVQAWGADPLGGMDARNLGDGALINVLLSYAKALKAVAAQPPDRSQRRESCVEILSWLCRLLVDRRAARRWTRPTEAGRVMPVHFAGTSALVHAALNDWPVLLQPDMDERLGFRPVRTADLADDVDPGAGTTRKAQAHRVVWKKVRSDGYPQGQEPLDGEHLKALKSDLEISALLDEPYVLTGVVASGTDAAHQDLIALGASLDIATVGRLGVSDETACKVLRWDEHKLNALIKACLKSIKEMP